MTDLHDKLIREAKEERERLGVHDRDEWLKTRRKARAQATQEQSEQEFPTEEFPAREPTEELPPPTYDELLARKKARRAHLSKYAGVYITVGFGLFIAILTINPRLLLVAPIIVIFGGVIAYHVLLPIILIFGGISAALETPEPGPRPLLYGAGGSNYIPNPAYFTWHMERLQRGASPEEYERFQNQWKQIQSDARMRNNAEPF